MITNDPVPLNPRLASLQVALDVSRADILNTCEQCLTEPLPLKLEAHVKAAIVIFYKYNIQMEKGLNYGLYICPKNLLRTYVVNYLNNTGFK